MKTSAAQRVKAAITKGVFYKKKKIEYVKFKNFNNSSYIDYISKSAAKKSFLALFLTFNEKK